MNHTKVIIARIPKHVQKALNVDWKGENRVYLQEELANSLVYRYENTYLKVLSEMSSIVKNPDFLIFDDVKRTLYLMRVYLTKCKIRIICVTVVKDGMFYFKSFEEIKNDEIYPQFEGKQLINL